METCHQRPMFRITILASFLIFPKAFRDSAFQWPYYNLITGHHNHLTFSLQQMNTPLCSSAVQRENYWVKHKPCQTSWMFHVEFGILGGGDKISFPFFVEQEWHFVWLQCKVLNSVRFKNVHLTKNRIIFQININNLFSYNKWEMRKIESSDSMVKYVHDCMVKIDLQIKWLCQ